MSTEERIVALEEGLAATQRDFLVRLTESNHQMAILNRVISEQVLNNREINRNVDELNRNATILLGIATSQERAIRLMQDDLGVVKGRVENIEQQLEGVGRWLEGVDQRLDGMDQRLEGVQQVLQQLVVLVEKLG
jgi:hypothetical protein